MNENSINEVELRKEWYKYGDKKPDSVKICNEDTFSEELMVFASFRSFKKKRLSGAIDF